jgi:hypothetical protein
VTISTYQVHNVLRTYNRQLRLGQLIHNRNRAVPQSTKDEVTISVEGKKQQIYKQFASQVAEKIAEKGCEELP